jgi:glucokinase
MSHKPRTILTLDAGGTNFVFSAQREFKEIVKPLGFAANGDHLEKCLKTLIQGFRAVLNQCDGKADAISFAFPGPADYRNGVIGDLGNLPAFRGGIALGPMLEEIFQMPVFINNDGDLFALGESMAGFLPWVNECLNQPARFQSLVGITLGTGTGGGVVVNGHLLRGDNSAGAEIWLLKNPQHTQSFVEESLSARAILMAYHQESNVSDPASSPEEVFQIAKALKPGDRQAALASFELFGEVLGQTLRQIITITDSPVVIGGGLARGWELFASKMMRVLEGSVQTLKGDSLPGLVSKVYDLENAQALAAFKENATATVKVPYSDRMVLYEPNKKIPLGRTKLGTSRAVALGAYTYACQQLDR